MNRQHATHEGRNLGRMQQVWFIGPRLVPVGSIVDGIVDRSAAAGRIACVQEVTRVQPTALSKEFLQAVDQGDGGALRRSFLAGQREAEHGRADGGGAGKLALADSEHRKDGLDPPSIEVKRFHISALQVNGGKHSGTRNGCRLRKQVGGGSAGVRRGLTSRTGLAQWERIGSAPLR